jgi:hypothetical protein
MAHQCNETDRGKPKYSGKNLSHCHFFQHKSHVDWRGIEPGPPRWRPLFAFHEEFFFFHVQRVWFLKVTLYKWLFLLCMFHFTTFARIKYLFHSLRHSSYVGTYKCRLFKDEFWIAVDTHYQHKCRQLISDGELIEIWREAFVYLWSYRYVSLGNINKLYLSLSLYFL